MFGKFLKIDSQEKFLNNANTNYFFAKSPKWYVFVIICYNQIHNNFKKKNFSCNKKLNKKNLLQILNKYDLTKFKLNSLNIKKGKK